MYNMWSSELLSLLLLFRDDLINPFDVLDHKDIMNAIHEAIEETINEYAWELMAVHNLSLDEAHYIVVKQLVGK